MFRNVGIIWAPSGLIDRLFSGVLKIAMNLSVTAIKILVTMIETPAGLGASALQGVTILCK